MIQQQLTAFVESRRHRETDAPVGEHLIAPQSRSCESAFPETAIHNSNTISHLLVLLVVAFCVPFVAPNASARSAQEADDLPVGLSATDWSSLTEAYEAGRHAAVEVGDGYEARNPGQRWRTRFDGRGFTTRPDAGGWTWGLELVRYGFVGQERDVASPTRVNADGQCMAYDWDATLTEWYRNDTSGLEHGYTVHQRPPRAGSGAGSLAFVLAVRGDLSPIVQAGGRNVRFVDARGVAALIYSGLTVFDADGNTLPARFDVVAEGLHLTVEERGARYPLTIDPIAQQAYLKASNTDGGDTFGDAITIAGDTVAVGASGEASTATGVNGDQSNNSAQFSGAVYIFIRNGTSWTQQAYLKASNTDLFPSGGAGDRFGAWLSLSRDTLVVGASEEDSDATGVNGDQNNDNAGKSGAAYVFVRSGTTWTQQAYLKASNTEVFDVFGQSVAISGDTIVVGAVREDSSATGVNGDQSDNSASLAGAAYVFVRSGTTWSQQAYLKASNTESLDGFANVAISGDTVVVSAAGEDSSATGVGGDQGDNSGVNSGAAYVFVRNGTTWTQQAYLKASNTEAGDGYGSGPAVSVSGDTLAIGAASEDSNATGVDGDQSDNSAVDSGAVYIFVRDGTTWTQQAYLKASNTDAGDAFGGALSLSDSGDTLVVTAGLEKSNATGVNGDQSDNSANNAGAAYVFVRNGTTWGQQAYLKASNTNAGDFFGFGAAVFGNAVLVSAVGEGSNAAGVNGDETDNSALFSGAVYHYEIPAPLASGTTSLSLAAGGQQAMTLDAGATRATWFYWVFGSATGTSPGLNFGGGVILPLVFDAYFNLTLTRPFLGAFGSFVGQLDAQGVGLASLNLPPGADPALAGITLNHAYLAAPMLGGASFASNAISVLLSR